MNLKLNDLRKKAGYRSSEVCEKLGITQMVLRNAEYRGIPIKLKKDMIPKLAEIYSVSELDVRRADNNTRKKIHQQILNHVIQIMQMIIL